MTRYDEVTAKAVGVPAGSVMTVEFEIEGQKFVALNGSGDLKFNHAVSFVVNCKTQAELEGLKESYVHPFAGSSAPRAPRPSSQRVSSALCAVRRRSS